MKAERLRKARLVWAGSGEETWKPGNPEVFSRLSLCCRELGVDGADLRTGGAWRCWDAWMDRREY